MGFTPQQVNKMSLWEFLACSESYAEAHGGKKSGGDGDFEEHELRAMGIEGF